MSFYIRNDEVTTDKEKLLSALDNLYQDLKIQGNKNVRERDNPYYEIVILKYFPNITFRQCKQQS